jgi:hypothetical protein
MKNYYVYVYLDPRKSGIWKTSELAFYFEPFYVGEGKNSRKFDHLKEEKVSHKTNRIKEILTDNFTPYILTIEENLSKDESTDLETNLIKQIGTRAIIEGVSRGPLTNLRLYGKKGNISEETKAKMSLAKLGVKFTEEHCKKLSAARAGRSYERAPTGPISDEHKLKLSLANIGKKRSTEAKERMSKAQSGRAISPEHKQKISEACKGRESPNVKSWQIEFESGESTITVDKLRTWCNERGIIYNSLRNTLSYGTYYKGMKLLKM